MNSFAPEQGNHDDAAPDYGNKEQEDLHQHVLFQLLKK
ncbi:hypothetical protein GPEL0_01r1382 [Geoanaerobacter pelophilus]|uniref:Uncharacterized protein n=1 Tax=Geoanaerobacter pelophilus TaxID=60036 RepID=A0ABQ0MGG6_9BACT|nr:hypothetical protein GPEL0_01r1382 [Geoanaerobacter pelophilus]